MQQKLTIETIQVKDGRLFVTFSDGAAAWFSAHELAKMSQVLPIFNNVHVAANLELRGSTVDENTNRPGGSALLSKHLTHVRWSDVEPQDNPVDLFYRLDGKFGTVIN